MVIQSDSGGRFLVTDDTNLDTEAGYTPMPSGGAVDSVNSQTGIVVLDAADVGADPAGSAATAQAFAVQRANHTGQQAAGTITGLAAVATSGAYGDLTGQPTIPPGPVTYDFAAEFLAIVNA